MSRLHVGIVGFDITPEIHPELGAWGTTPSLTEIDMPLLASCIALRQDDRLLVWFGSDLVGEGLTDTNGLRDEVADALGLQRRQIIWSTSQTHSSGAIPGSQHTASAIVGTAEVDPAALTEGRRQFVGKYIEAGRQAIAQLQPARVWAGRGYCDTVGYNTRLPMPGGGVKFSRNYAEGLQSGKYYDPVIGLVRFDDDQGRPLGAIFNFDCHPATLIIDKYVSPDWVGPAREYVQDTIGGAPAMFVQGFCGDVRCRHMFGTREQVRQTGARLGQAAAKAMHRLIPARAEPFGWDLKEVDIDCQPPPARNEIEAQIAGRLAFIEELESDPQATWACGINVPEQMTTKQRAAMFQVHIRYFEELRRMLDTGEQPRRTLQTLLGAVRIGDVGAALAPGENFALTALRIRQRSPFVHTLICGDTNGLFGYLGTDEEIDRGGYETESYWRMIGYEGLRLPPAKGSAQRVVDTCTNLLKHLQNTPSTTHPT